MREAVSRTKNMLRPSCLITWILAPIAFGFWIAALDSLANYFPLASAYADFTAALTVAGYAAVKIVIGWALLFPFVVVTPAVLWNADPIPLSMVTAAGSATIIVLGIGGLTGVAEVGVPLAAFTLGSFWLAQRRSSQEAVIFLRRSLLTAIALAVLCFLFVWTGHFPFRGVFRDWPRAVFAAYVATVILAVTPLLVTRVRSWLRLSVAIALAVATLAPGRFPFSETFRVQAAQIPLAASPGIPHVVLIVIDTLRADATSYLNPRAPRTPHLDSLAADGIVFERAISPAPWTFPAMLSLMSGVAPYIETTDYYYKAAPLPTLANYLAEAGYRTRAIIGNPLLFRPYNVVEGFEEVDTFAERPLGESPASRGLALRSPLRFVTGGNTRTLTREAVHWLQGATDEPFFLWLHYYDPHHPYAPPPAYLIEKNIGHPIWEDAPQVVAAADQARARALYDSEVRFVDEAVGRVLEELKRLGIYDDSLIILTSDHGEEFWEHGGQKHAHTVYQELLHVPLVIRLPGQPSAKRIRTLVPTQAILPTVLELCGIQTANREGWLPSLVPLMQDEECCYDQPIVSGATQFVEFQWSVIIDGMKYVKRTSSGSEELYDLEEDPGETESVLGGHPEVAAAARAILEKHDELAASIRKDFGLEPDGPDEEMLKRLRSLGYIQGGTTGN